MESFKEFYIINIIYQPKKTHWQSLKKNKFYDLGLSKLIRIYTIQVFQKSILSMRNVFKTMVNFLKLICFLFFISYLSVHLINSRFKKICKWDYIIRILVPKKDPTIWNLIQIYFSEVLLQGRKINFGPKFFHHFICETGPKITLECHIK